jgi:Arc/MetJ-type ribon-helix-helix transcriptional regulator
MNITLNAHTQRLLEDRLKSGEFRSADDVVSAALDALDMLSAPGLDQQTLDAIDRAEDQIERGEVHDWNAVRERVRARFRGK